MRMVRIDSSTLACSYLCKYLYISPPNWWTLVYHAYGSHWSVYYAFGAGSRLWFTMGKYRAMMTIVSRSALKERAEEPRIGADLGWHTPVDRARCCGMMVLS